MAVLARWSPWSRFTDLLRESDELMRDMLAGLGVLGGGQGTSSAAAGEQATGWMPAVDVLTRGNDYGARRTLRGGPGEGHRHVGA